MPKYTQFLERFAIKAPIIQAPMANVSTPKLAAEVYKAGGLGSLPMSPVDLTKDTTGVFKLIDQFREAAGAGAPVNCNFFCFDPREQHLPTAQEAENWQSLYAGATGQSPREVAQAVPQFSARAVVSFAEFEQQFPRQCAQFVDQLVGAAVGMVLFHFGVPSPQTIRQLQQGGIFVMGTATSVAEALHLVEAGVDGIVLQGYEAGGHRGNYLARELDEQLPTSSLFALVVRALREKNLGQRALEPLLVPAGGIVRGESGARYLRDGAGAVQLGTLFVPVLESAAPGFIGEAVTEKRAIPTVMTSLISGRSARTLATPFVSRLVTEDAQAKLPLPTFGYSTSAFRAFAQGRSEFGFYLAGTNYHLVEAGVSTAHAMQRFIADLDEHL